MKKNYRIKVLILGLFSLLLTACPESFPYDHKLRFTNNASNDLFVIVNSGNDTSYIYHFSENFSLSTLVKKETEKKWLNGGKPGSWNKNISKYGHFTIFYIDYNFYEKNEAKLQVDEPNYNWIPNDKIYKRQIVDEAYLDSVNWVLVYP